jgi:3-isopropylmalate dehydrogenase
LRNVAELSGEKIEFEEELIGGISIDERGVPISEEVIEKAKKSDAVFLGAVGGPKWDNLPIEKRPEKGLLELRKSLGVWANIRPIRVFPALKHVSPLKNPDGIDFVVIRELTSGIYFGEPRGYDEEKGYNTAIYRRYEVERIAHLAFRIARQRKRKVSSIDKANVLEVSAFWRKVVSEVANQYPDVSLEHIYVDSASLYMITNPQRFDVMLCSNLFGDILSDEGGGIVGSLGLCPSASLGDMLYGEKEGEKSQEASKESYRIKGLYEPVHGSAPDIAGKGIANPIASILSASMLLRYSLGLEKYADIVEKAVELALEKGFRTPDIAEKGKGKRKIKVISTSEFGDAVIECVDEIVKGGK